MAPSAIALIGPMKPAAGVTATRPTTMAVAPPTAVGFFPRATSSSVHATSVAAGASIVVVNARAASPLAATALPALKPNHPNQSSPAPSSVNGTLCGSIAVLGYSSRLPTTIAATPALTCTTVSPAKSSAPILASHPAPHTQWAIGVYTISAHSVMKVTYAEKRMRSTIAPEISAAVMMQNVA